MSRRFQKVDLDEPSVAETIKILEGLKPKFEEHHQLKYSGGSIKAAAELSAKHIRDKFLPDKAIDVIDEAGARIRLSSSKRKTVSEQDIQKIISQMAKIPDDVIESLRDDKPIADDKLEALHKFANIINKNYLEKSRL